MPRFALLIAFFFLFTAVLCDGQATAPSPKLRLLTYGLPDIWRSDAEKVVAGNWGIEYYRVAGCSVTKEMADSVERYNNTVIPLIEAKYGKDWQAKFDKDVELEYTRQELVSIIVDNQKFIAREQQKMDRKGYQLVYQIKPIANTVTYEVSVNAVNTNSSSNETLPRFKILVNYRKKTVEMIADNRKK